MSPLEGALAGLLLLWFALCVAVQIPVSRKWIQPRDALNLVPAWNFFAPTPGRGDYHLLFRDQTADGDVTDWRELSNPEGRPWYTFAWNPEKRPRKALFDVAQSCALISQAQDAELMCGTYPYLVLLNHVAAYPRTNGAVATQFLIMYSHGYCSELEPEPVMVSNLHDLD